jgi:hypothetical protein
MRLAYIDEAGISHKGQEPFLVVVGVIIHADNNLVAIERHLDKLVTRHIPEQHHHDFVFHATELFNGGGKVFRRENPDFPLSKRLQIADDLAAIPRRFNVTIAVGFVDRHEFPRTSMPEFASMSAHEQTVAAHGVAFVNCAMQIEHWMREHAKRYACMFESLMVRWQEARGAQLKKELLDAFRHMNIFTEEQSERCGKALVFLSQMRIPTKPATHSNRKPATDSDLKPAGIPI